MRTLIGRCLAVLAVVAGIGVGASSLPASAATPSASHPAAGSTHSRVAPADWWL